MHQPVREENCTACHVRRSAAHPLIGGKSWELTAKGAAFCEQCHSPLVLKKVVHSPVKSGECTGCHRPHGAEGRNLLDDNKNLTATCTGCHDSAPFKQQFMHGPVAVGQCAECHHPHSSAENALLTQPSRELCLRCHVDFSRLIQESPIVHAPVRNDACTSCHNPHGAPNNMFLKKKMPDLCVGCHQKIGKHLADLKTPHKPVQEGKGCGNCHSAHFGKVKGLFPADAKGLCLDCHGTDKLGSPPLRNIKKEIEGKKFLHGPLREGECRGCHDPHGSQNFRLLRGSYPADLYAPYRDGIYGACLNCHEKNLLRFADTTVYTKFRNGNRNLHYVHVAIKRKGRTCRVCHEAHASNGEKLISKEGSQFGDWKIPLNFQITPTGGSCAPGCHRAFTYDRNTPQSYGTEEQEH
ncbi:cytochrome c3 family protein [Geobacter sp. SVR]|uniref:cytochrome c3 family protein n=1 Tax=Geobacter sp. SVR TaxID=2495594 RepID=UPI00143EF7C1|nr:cytochrome c3 family protein [Geobacter sp. SVR]BCS53275.1 cytochrome c [Geobacter sp. SVR]GCF85599.1 cytochrome c [Geobacter sp. SVR]